MTHNIIKSCIKTTVIVHYYINGAISLVRWPGRTLRGNIPHLNWARTNRNFFDTICLIYDSPWHSLLNKTYVRSLGTQLISIYYSSRSNLSNSVEAYVIPMGILDSNMFSMSRQELFCRYICSTQGYHIVFTSFKIIQIRAPLKIRCFEIRIDTNTRYIYFTYIGWKCFL